MKDFIVIKDILIGIIIIQTSIELQIAYAVAFENELNNLGTNYSYISNFKQEMEVKRNYMAGFLSAANYTPTVPEGGIYIIANFSKLIPKVEFDATTDYPMDYQFVKWLVKNAKIFVIPLSNYYNKGSKKYTQDALRFIFMKVSYNLNDF